MRRTLAIAALLAVFAAPALAQEEKARKGLEVFLKDALGADDKLERIERDPSMDFATPGACAFTRWGEFTATVDSRTGDVRFYSRFKPLLYVRLHDDKGAERTAADRQAEIARRAKLSLDESVKKAKAFLDAHYPAFKERTFEVTEKERLDRDALVQDDLVFTERPAKGAVACWPNRIDVSVNPETGAIVTYVADDHRVESKEKPRVKKEAARKAVLDRFGGKLKPENRAWLEKDAPVDLVAVEGDKPGEGKTAWLVARRFVVDARTGACRLLGEK
jgi:hypothetical protein